MAANTGRTVSKWVKFQVKDSGGVLRDIPIDSINGVGLDYPEKDLTAFQDVIHGALPEIPNAPITITGPIDTTAAVVASGDGAAAAISGSHIVLPGIAGGNTPLTLAVYVGMRHAWTAGEPVFGLASSATSGYLCSSYVVDLSAQKYTAKFMPFPGSSVPAWGTAILA